MNVGDLVVVMNKDVVSGINRPSLATIMSIDGEKVLVESVLQTFTSPRIKWVTDSAFCMHVDPQFVESVTHREKQTGNFEAGDLVMFVDNNSYNVVEGVVVNVTPKTVEIMENGSLKIRRKNKNLVMQLV
jgi:hypothetical protein